ncbi:unnamed protein product [Trichobilharzia regenti]|nr:unnamed protein product [Trichobilharzia regenti]
MGLQKPKEVAKLSEDAAVDLGAEVLGEVIIFVVGASCLLLEYRRQVRKEANKEDYVQKTLDQLTSQVNELMTLVDIQEAKVRELTKAVATSKVIFKYRLDRFYLLFSSCLVEIGLQQMVSKYVLGVDFGSTHACARVYTTDLKAIGSSSTKVSRIEGSDGSCELDPEAVWDCLCRLLDSAVRGNTNASQNNDVDANIRPDQIKCIGISVQRNSLVLWDK